MEVTAQLRNLRIAPRKVRLVSGLLKGMDVIQAKFQLRQWPKRSSQPISKLLDSAMANAHNNYGLIKENLFIKEISVDGGTVLKRFMSKGFGSASPILKRTSHIRIILDEKMPGLKVQPRQTAEKSPIDPMPSSAESNRPIDEPKQKRKLAKDEATPQKGLVSEVKSIGRKFFRRKSI